MATTLATPRSGLLRPSPVRAWWRDAAVLFASVMLLAAHIVLISLGYATNDRTRLIAEVWTPVTTYAGMLLATAGSAVLVLVAATSVRVAWRRLRYESWHLLHLYAYLGVGLALPHQVWTGADFTASPVAAAFWWTTYALAVGAVLLFQLGLSVFEGPHGTLTATVRKRRKVATFATGMAITPLRALLAELPYAPGEAVLFYWSGRQSYLLFRRQLEDLGRAPGHPDPPPARAPLSGQHVLVAGRIRLCARPTAPCCAISCPPSRSRRPPRPSCCCSATAPAPGRPCSPRATRPAAASGPTRPRPARRPAAMGRSAEKPLSPEGERPRPPDQFSGRPQAQQGDPPGADRQCRGATYTPEGYQRSFQSAIDAAHTSNH